MGLVRGVVIFVLISCVIRFVMVLLLINLCLVVWCCNLVIGIGDCMDCSSVVKFVVVNLCGGWMSIV